MVEGSQSDFCTGSVINSLYVLTAAHCVCAGHIAPEGREPCIEDERGRLKINYNVTGKDNLLQRDWGSMHDPSNTF